VKTMCPEEIWTNYNLKLKNYIMKHVLNQYDAEDILQEVGVRLQKKSIELKDITNLEAWLYRITRNLIVDYFRGANKYSLVEDINEISFPSSYEQENYNKETSECLLKLVDYLPATYKEAIIESDYYGSDNLGNIIEFRNRDNSRTAFSCIQCKN